MDFIAIDVETANADMASICQIGLAKYCNGELTDEWCSLVNPNDYFDFYNVDVHGIEPQMVNGAPTFTELISILRDYMQGMVCVSHTSFDRVSISRANNKYNLEQLPCVWLDSARVARRAWQQFSQKGYGLQSICNHLGYEFRHHDALEDAKAAGFVLLSAVQKTGIQLEDWLERIHQPIDLSQGDYTATTKSEGNPEGDLFGEYLCFTGTLQIPRREATALAAQAGCNVGGLTKKTTLLVVGDQDISRLAGQEKSSKHRKAEDLISEGQRIRILQESDFLELLKSVGTDSV